MWRAYKRGLSMADLPTLPLRDQARVVGERLQRIWEEVIKEAQKKGEKPSLVEAVWR